MAADCYTRAMPVGFVFLPNTFFMKGISGGVTKTAERRGSSLDEGSDTTSFGNGDTSFTALSYSDGGGTATTQSCRCCYTLPNS